MKKIVCLFIILLALLSCFSIISYADTYYDYYIVNKTSNKFHLPNCSYLPEPSNRYKISCDEINEYSKLSPCKHCNPLKNNYKPSYSNQSSNNSSNKENSKYYVIKSNIKNIQEKFVSYMFWFSVILYILCIILLNIFKDNEVVNNVLNVLAYIFMVLTFLGIAFWLISFISFYVIELFI